MKSRFDREKPIGSPVQPNTFSKTHRHHDRLDAAKRAPSVSITGEFGDVCYRPLNSSERQSLHLKQFLDLSFSFDNVNFIVSMRSPDKAKLHGWSNSKKVGIFAADSFFIHSTIPPLILGVTNGQELNTPEAFSFTSQISSDCKHPRL